MDKSYLSRFRRLRRGSDDAVDIISDRSNLIELLNNSPKHSRDELNQAIASCYSGASYGVYNWPKIIPAWTQPEQTTIHGYFAEYHPYLKQLNLDHGVMTHMHEFMSFLEKNPPKNKDYRAVREDFKQHLGNRTVWRGMYLTEQEAESAAVNGIESTFLRKIPKMSFMLKNFEANILSTYFPDILESHFHNENFESPIISVTEHKDVAIAIGRYFGRHAEEKPKELYLFKINIPEIDLIYYNNIILPLPKISYAMETGLRLSVSIDHTNFSHPWDRKIESYVMYKINPNEIISITKPKVTISSFNGKEIKWK